MELLQTEGHQYGVSQQPNTKMPQTGAFPATISLLGSDYGHDETMARTPFLAQFNMHDPSMVNNPLRAPFAASYTMDDALMTNNPRRSPFAYSYTMDDPSITKNSLRTILSNQNIPLQHG